MSPLFRDFQETLQNRYRWGYRKQMKSDKGKQKTTNPEASQSVSPVQENEAGAAPTGYVDADGYFWNSVLESMTIHEETGKLRAESSAQGAAREDLLKMMSGSESGRGVGENDAYQALHKHQVGLLEDNPIGRGFAYEQKPASDLIPRSHDDSLKIRRSANGNSNPNPHYKAVPSQNKIDKLEESTPGITRLSLLPKIFSRSSKGLEPILEGQYDDRTEKPPAEQALKLERSNDLDTYHDCYTINAVDIGITPNHSYPSYSPFFWGSQKPTKYWPEPTICPSPPNFLAREGLPPRDDIPVHNPQGYIHTHVGNARVDDENWPLHNQPESSLYPPGDASSDNHLSSIHPLPTLSSTPPSPSSTTQPPGLTTEDEVLGYRIVSSDAIPSLSTLNRLYEKTIVTQARSIEKLRETVDVLAESRDYLEHELLPQVITHWEGIIADEQRLDAAVHALEDENAMLWSVIESSRKLLEFCWERETAVLSTARLVRRRKINRANCLSLGRLVGAKSKKETARLSTRGESPFKEDLEQLIYVVKQNLKLLLEDIGEWGEKVEIAERLRADRTKVREGVDSRKDTDAGPKVDASNS